MSNTSLDCVHIDQSVLVHSPESPTSVGVLPFAKNTTEYIGWHWDTEYYGLRVKPEVVFELYTPIQSLLKNIHILSVAVVNQISKLPLAPFQNLMLSTPNFNLEITSASCLDTEFPCLVFRIPRRYDYTIRRCWQAVKYLRTARWTHMHPRVESFSVNF